MWQALWFIRPEASLPSSTYLLWYALYAALFALFYVFSSPFTGNRELRKNWSGYVYVSTILYIWLGMAVAFHLPILQYDVKVPVSLFSPLFLASALTLFACEGALKLLNRWFVFHVGFRQNSLEVMQNSFVVSLACCFVYSQCGSVTHAGLMHASQTSAALGHAFLQHPSHAAAAAALESELDKGIDNMCIALFSGHVGSKWAHLPMVGVLWCTAMSALVLNFFIERISGFRGMFSESYKPTAASIALAHATAAAAAAAAAGATGVSAPEYPDQQLLRRTRSSSAASEDGTCSECATPRPDDETLSAEEKARQYSARFATSSGANAAVAAAFAAQQPPSPSDAPSPSPSPYPSPSPLSSSASASGSCTSLLHSSYKAALHLIRPNLFREMLSPPMLEMVPWYALLTTFTGVDMLIHMRLFVGRFDMRTLQAAIPNSFHYPPPLYAGHALASETGAGGPASGLFARSRSNSLPGVPPSLSATGMHFAGEHSVPTSPLGGSRSFGGGGGGHAHAHAQAQAQSELAATHVHPHHLDAPLVYDHCAQDEELWFDWMADCGDGWNPSYQVCRVLAKPLLNVSVRRKGGRKPGAMRLPRAKMLIIGGDLAYPNPSEATYESRLFRPFQCALPPPLNYDPSALSMHKPPVPGGVAGLVDYAGPTCFAIPGNHDWFDGLQTYLRYICARDWLGGWLLPQERSFFALQLPKGWWLFGLDNALSDDIDALQFKYFASLIERMADDDRVIIATHEPDWIIDTHDQRTSGENTNYLIKILKGKVALRIAGDIHNYTRHMPSPLVPGVRATMSARAAVGRAFNASAASSLFRGVLDRVFSSRSNDEGDEHTVSGVVDATLNRAAEAARLHAEEQAELAAKLQQSQSGGAGAAGEEVSYTSMLYSRWTGWGGDGEGVFLEDIIDDILPTIPLLRTQSMPAFAHGAAEKIGRNAIAAAAAASAAAAGAAAAAPFESGRLSSSKVGDTPLKQRRQVATHSTLSPPTPLVDFAQLDLDQEQQQEGEQEQERNAAAARRNRKKREARRRREEEAAGASASSSAPALALGLSNSSSVADHTHAAGQSSAVSSGAPTPRLSRGGGGGSAGDRKARASRASSAIPCTTAQDAISSWSVAEVLDWLSSVGVEDGAVHVAFSAHDVDGVLLQNLDEADLAGELGVLSGLRRKKILAEVRALLSRARRDDVRATQRSQSQQAQTNSGAEEESEDVSSDNSASEQLTLNILSGSTLDLSSGRDNDWNSGDGPSSDRVAAMSLHSATTSGGATSSARHTLQLPPAPPAVVPEAVGLASTPRASSGPELSLTAPVLPLGSTAPAYGARNVDLVSQPLIGLSAISAPLSLHPSAAAVVDATVGLSAAARKRLKKKRAAAAEEASRGTGLNPRSIDASVVPLPTAPELRTNERLFDEATMGASASANASSGSRASAPAPGPGSPRRRQMARSSRARQSVTLYNNASSAPIPTDLRESINICLPDGQDAPREMMLGATGDVGMDSSEEWPGERGDDGGPGRARANAAAAATAASLEGLSLEPNVRPPPVLIVSGGGGAFMHPTHVPDPEPILFRGNRYVRASSYPPVALSRAYALLNLFGFRKQNWRFDMFGGVLYFLLAFNVLPVCDLSAVIHSASWYDALWQYVLAVLHNHATIFLHGYTSLITFALILLALVSFGEVPWPWYKRLLIGTLHTLAHSLTAISALVLLETAIELGRDRKIIGQGDSLYGIFTRNFPAVLRIVDVMDASGYGVFGVLIRWLSNVFDVPDSIAVYKKMMCESYGLMSRPQVLIYYFNCALYLWLLMAPAVSFMFGAYLYLASSFLNAHYTEAFSSLRIEGYKNVVRFHINTAGDLEVYTLGLDRVPTRWEKDPHWTGNDPGSAGVASHQWAKPSVLRPEKDQPDRIKLIDYLVINKNPRSKSSFVRQANQQAAAGQSMGARSNNVPAGAGAGGVVGQDRSASGPVFASSQRAQQAAAATSSRGPTVARLVVPGSPGGPGAAAPGSVAGSNARRLFTAQAASTLTPQPSPTAGTTEPTSLQLPHRRQLSKSSANLRPHTSRTLA